FDPDGRRRCGGLRRTGYASAQPRHTSGGVLPKHNRATRAEVSSRSTTGATRTEVCSRSTAALRDRRVLAEHNRAMRTECDRSTTEPCEPGVIAGARRRALAGAHLDDAANRSTARRAHTRERPGGVGLPGRSPQTNREVSRAGPAAVPLPAPRAAWPT